MRYSLGPQNVRNFSYPFHNLVTIEVPAIILAVQAPSAMQFQPLSHAVPSLGTIFQNSHEKYFTRCFLHDKKVILIPTSLNNLNIKVLKQALC